VTLAQLNLPTAELWQGLPIILYSAVGVLGAITLDDYLGAGLTVAQLQRVQQYERDLRAILSGGLLLMVKKYGPPWERIGAHAFLTHGAWRWKRLRIAG
jgi:hypothetical protein